MYPPLRHRSRRLLLTTRNTADLNHDGLVRLAWHKMLVWRHRPDRRGRLSFAAPCGVARNLQRPFPRIHQYRLLCEAAAMSLLPHMRRRIVAEMCRVSLLFLLLLCGLLVFKTELAAKLAILNTTFICRHRVGEEPAATFPSSACIRTIYARLRRSIQPYVPTNPTPAGPST